MSDNDSHDDDDHHDDIDDVAFESGNFVILCPYEIEGFLQC